jgi:hypothetical protein
MTRSEFHFFKKGKRQGAPLSQCKRCMRYRHNRDPNGGFVGAEQFRPVFLELVRRIGYIETCRRLKLSSNLLYRVRKGEQQHMRMRTFEKLKAGLELVKARGEQRHPLDIRHGTAARGKVELRLQLRAATASAKTGQTQESFYRDRNAVDMSEPDSRWWVDSGMGWYPRYGDEMLGADF